MRITGLIFLLGLFGASPSYGQMSRDTSFVWARNGLSLREESNKSGKRIKVLPYGTPLKPLVGWNDLIQYWSFPSAKPINGERVPRFFLKGNWIRFWLAKIPDYVFDGYF